MPELSSTPLDEKYIAAHATQLSERCNLSQCSMADTAFIRLPCCLFCTPHAAVRREFRTSGCLRMSPPMTTPHQSDSTFVWLPVGILAQVTIPIFKLNDALVSSKQSNPTAGSVVMSRRPPRSLGYLPPNMTPPNANPARPSRPLSTSHSRRTSNTFIKAQYLLHFLSIRTIH